jgi:hypothetical protein
MRAEADRMFTSAPICVHPRLFLILFGKSVSLLSALNG